MAGSGLVLLALIVGVHRFEGNVLEPLTGSQVVAGHPRPGGSEGTSAVRGPGSGGAGPV